MRKLKPKTTDNKRPTFGGPNYCVVCGAKLFYNKQIEVCSIKCAAARTRSEQKYKSYQKICYANHKRACVVCGENVMVEVHHLDSNRENNLPSNLIPLCPTHHRMWHSKHKNLILDKVLVYVNNFKRNNNAE